MDVELRGGREGVGKGEEEDDNDGRHVYV